MRRTLLRPRGLILAFWMLLITSGPLWVSAVAGSASGSHGPLPPRAAIQWLKGLSHVPRFGYRVVATVPHDPQAFTQGFLFDRERFYESTGLRGDSTLREIDPVNGRVLRQQSLPETYFGEGLALFDGRLYQLTWQGRTGFVYHGRDLELLDTFSYPTEGWGLTHNGLYFIQSDGSDQLYFRTFDTFQLHHTRDVRENGRPVTRINELEYIHGRIWANVWMTQRLAIIDPDSGRVAAWVDLAGLQAQASDGRPGSVLNGIAHDPGQDRLWVTGKRWSLIFEIQLIPPASVVPSSADTVTE